MAKTITLTINKKDYTLEFNRRTVAWMEDEGFNTNDFASKPATMIPILFHGSMRMHHPTVKSAEVDEIFATIKGKSELIEKLIEMYSDVLNSLLDDPEGDEGNAMWSMNW